MRSVIAALLILMSGFTSGTSDPVESSGAFDERAEKTFEIDIAHSTLNYRIRHFDVSWFFGRINQPSGSFRLDRADAANSFINITAQIKNMDTGAEQRDRFLLSPDFFNVREFPTAEFASTSVRAVDDDTVEAAGELTMHGVTKTITVTIDEYTERDTSRFGYRAGFLCTFTIKRSDFGMSMHADSLGDEVIITASIEGVRR